MPKLVLIDGHSLAYRAYHALPPSMQTTKGELTNAVYGFVSTLLKIMREEQPDYLAVAFDVGRTFRDDLFTDYKGHRERMPDDLAYQIARIDAVVRAFGLPVLTLDGYEADDVLGTAARLAAKQGADTVIYTGDTDAFQLVDAHTTVVVSRRQFGDLAEYDEAAVKERYGLAPRQLVDYRGLKGDTSDNIPGVPGIGEKTATDLLQKYDTLDGVYKHLDEVTPKRAKEALAANETQARLSHKLAQIVTNAPLTLDLAACRPGSYDMEAVRALFRELEFRSFLEKLPTEKSQTPNPKPQAVSAEEPTKGEAKDEAEMATTPGAMPAANDYATVRDAKTLKKVVTQLKKAKAFAIDTETTSPNAFECELVGISLSVREGQAWYIPVGHARPQQELLTLDGESDDDFRNMPLDEARELLGPVFADPKIKKYGHNINFDALVLAEAGLPLDGIAYDTMVAAFLIDPGSRQLGLKALGFNRLGREMTEITTLIGKGKEQITIGAVPISQVATYACDDANVTYALVNRLTPDLKARNAWELFTTLEMPLVPVLIAMERAGVTLDTAYLAAMKDELEKRLDQIQRDIYRSVGHEFNLNSTQQLGKVLFEELQLDASGSRKTKQGGYSTAVEVLEQLRGAHAVVDLLLEYRQLDKLQSTYVEALPVLVSQKDGRLHTSYNQTGAVTGRISSSDPNLQNIPIRTELGRKVRRAFIAPKGHKLIKADYSQVELRILAHMSRDPRLLEAFQNQEDVHIATAAAIFGVPVGEVTKNMRAIAKTTNYAIVYGISAFGLAAQTDLSQKEADQFIRSYFEKYPGVKQYLDDTKEKARTIGYVETLLGRRRYFPELQSRAGNYNMRAAAERMAINAPVQGTSADIMKIAMLRIADALAKRKLKSRMILQVHDELVFEAPDKEVKAVAALAREIMSGAYELDVPLEVEVKAGPSWDELEDA
ncbi:MAG: DNA polymerase I [Chloroflexi bacterium]|nr:DNA polymerase I [Chloroflexota bacterium]